MSGEMAPLAASLPPGFGAPPLAPKPGELSPQNILPLSPGNPTSAFGPPIGAAAGGEVAHPKAPRRLRWPGIVFPLLFLILAAIMVYLVLDLSELLPHSKAQLQHPAPAGELQSAANGEPRRRAAEAPRSPIVSTAFDRPAAASPPENPPPPAGVPPHAPPKRPIIEDQDRHREGEVPVAPMIDLDSRETSPDQSNADTPGRETASAVLEKFLAAQTLEARRPYLSESRRSATVLAGSALAKPLPEVLDRRRVPYVQDSSDQHVEHFFEVEFQISTDRLPTRILVQLNEWGDGAIRVHTDAFLDLFNDEIGIFGLAPVEGERTFHVVADAYKNCFDDRIPDAASKGFIKLRPHPRITPPRLTAYFHNKGALAAKISEPDGLPWGSSDICTVTVQWNTDLPDQPFVELVRIDGFGTWNP